MAKRGRKKKKGNTISRFLFFIVFIALILGLCYYLLGIKRIQDMFLPKEENIKIIDVNSNERPIGIVINNASPVWNYQSGLNSAYIVYEMLAEGGITRELAIFKGKNPQKVASVRSARHYFLDYALENDAVFVHWGYSPQAKTDMNTLGINHIDGLTYENRYFFRDRNLNIASEHTGYTTISDIKKAIKDLDFKDTTNTKPVLDYSVNDVMDEEYEDANRVKIPFSNSYTASFVYNKDDKLYSKYQNDTLMKDYTTGETIKTKNIIILFVTYQGIYQDEKGRLNMQNIGTGDGKYISNGKVVDITWEKSYRGDTTVYYLDNKKLSVNDGNTYIEFMPSDEELIIE